jgi:type I restriction enzyme S subunit
MKYYESQFRKLNEVGSVNRGKSKHRPRNAPELYGGPYPFIQTGDVKAANFFITTYKQTYSERGLAQSKLWQPGTLLITIAANIADTAVLKIPACFPDSIIGFIPKKGESDVRFIKYCLDTYKTQMQSISQGTTQDNLSQGKLLSLRFRIPKYEHQQKIAAILLAYDELIENNSRRITMLDRMAEALYREWFVRHRFPGHESVKSIKGVPVTWDQTTFGKFCMLKRGYDLPDQNVVPGEYPVVASTSIKTYHNAYKVKPPVITTGRSGSLGTVLMVNCRAWPLNTALYVKDFFGNSPYLVFYTLKSMGLDQFNAGAGVPTLNRNHLNGIKMAIPDKDLQRKFDSLVAPFHNQIEQLNKATALLTQVRESLLPRLISGKLSVENLDTQFPPGMADQFEIELTAAKDA